MTNTVETIVREEERAARCSPICAGCGAEKSNDLVVCWNCFKYRKDGRNFKYFPGPVSAWVKALVMTVEEYEADRRQWDARWVSRPGVGRHGEVTTNCGQAAKE